MAEEAWDWCACAWDLDFHCFKWRDTNHWRIYFWRRSTCVACGRHSNIQTNFCNSNKSLIKVQTDFFLHQLKCQWNTIIAKIAQVAKNIHTHTTLQNILINSFAFRQKLSRDANANKLYCLFSFVCIVSGSYWSMVHNWNCSTIEPETNIISRP